MIYLQQQGDTVKAMADRVDCHPSLISHIIGGRREVTAEMAIRIEKATDGMVARSQLRPDLWGTAS